MALENYRTERESNERVATYDDGTINDALLDKITKRADVTSRGNLVEIRSNPPFFPRVIRGTQVDTHRYESRERIDVLSVN